MSEQRVMVTGSRDWESEASITTALNLAEFYLCWFEEGLVLVSGGARGADSLAEGVARKLGMRIDQHLPDWQTHGKRAGILRNIAMLDSGVDLVIAFQRNDSKGTEHAITEARRRDIPVWIWSKHD